MVLEILVELKGGVVKSLLAVVLASDFVDDLRDFVLLVRLLKEIINFISFSVYPNLVLVEVSTFSLYHGEIFNSFFMTRVYELV